MLIDHHQLSDLQHQVQFKCEYPGQSLMVALAIVLRYPSIEAALSPSQSGCPAAQADSAIPGAGDAVSGALHRLKEGVEQGLDADRMVTVLNDYWRYLAGHQDSYRDRVEPGLAKAAPFEPEFTARWESWKQTSQAVAG